MTDDTKKGDPIPEVEVAIVTEAKQPTPEETVEALQAELVETKRQAEENKREADENKAARLQAERAREEATTKTSSAVDDAIKSREIAYTAAIDRAQTELEAAEERKAKALESGDTLGLIKADREATRALMLLERSEAEKQRFESWQEAQKVAVKRQDNGVSEKAKSWIAEHPRFNTDRYYKATAIAAHEEAIEQGCSPDSSAYFKHIEMRLAEKYETEAKPADTKQDTKPERTKSAASTAAPPSNNAADVKPRSTGRQRTLNSLQLEAASFMKMSPGEYAKYLDEIENEKQA